jgi:hypothetical protein
MAGRSRIYCASECSIAAPRSCHYGAEGKENNLNHNLDKRYKDPQVISKPSDGAVV